METAQYCLYFCVVSINLGSKMCRNACIVCRCIYRSLMLVFLKAVERCAFKAGSKVRGSSGHFISHPDTHTELYNRESRSIHAKLSMGFQSDQSETTLFKRPNFKSKHLTCDPKTYKDKWVITSPVLNVSQPYLNSRTAMSLKCCRCSNIRTKTVISSKSLGEQFS